MVLDPNPHHYQIYALAPLTDPPEAQGTDKGYLLFACACFKTFFNLDYFENKNS